ncbi:MAG: RNA polymerase sigma factor, partial [Isosphaeraceae bacterium]
MSTPSNRALRRDFETIFRTGTLAGLGDGELLERFAAASSHPGEEAEAAFALLVDRHGAGVLRVCRGVLGDRHEAEDAFQATFLVLIRRAGAIRRKESVGAWLLGVAYRVASCARDASRRRRGLERRWLERRQDAGEDPRGQESEPDIDLTAMIHAELGRLPENCRAAVVLCDLENRPVEEVARILGWPIGTVKSRLHRGRLRLR